MHDPFKFEWFLDMASRFYFEFHAVRLLIAASLFEAPNAADLFGDGHGFEFEAVGVHDVSDPYLCVPDKHPRTYIKINILLVISRFLWLEHHTFLGDIVILYEEGIPL